MDDHKLLLLEVASYNTSGKTNSRVLVEYNDHLNFIDKIIKHRLIHIVVVLKCWSKILNVKPFLMLLTRKVIQNW